MKRRGQYYFEHQLPLEATGFYVGVGVLLTSSCWQDAKSQAICQVKGNEAKTYGYDYDYLNGLKTAAYREYVSGVIDQSGVSKYFTLYTYHERGNLATLGQIGPDPQNPLPVKIVSKLVF